MPSMFSMSSPASLFQVWFVVYIYLLPFFLYATWASLAMMDLSETGEGSVRLGWSALVILVPLLGGGLYLLCAARAINRRARIAMVATGLAVWLLPLAVGIWLVGGPLGPKALS
jgi:hypothetical protein